MHRLEEQLVAVSPLAGLLLEREQLVGAQVPLVVGAAGAGKDWLGELRLGHRATFGRPMSFSSFGAGKAGTFALEPPSSLRLMAAARSRRRSSGEGRRAAPLRLR